MTDKIIKGSGGGGSPPPPPAPSVATDNLNSRQFATLQDLISEGEIEGFATASKEGLTKGTTAYNNAALKDVFFNNTPVLKANANSANPTSTDFNFQSVDFTPRFGTANQTAISGIESSESTNSVGITVKQTTPVTRQISNTEVDAAKVTITFPQLQEAKSNGDLDGASVSLKVQVQYNNGGFTDVVSETITGRSADAYQKDYRFSLTGAFPVDIRVVRVTADSTNSSLQDQFVWTSLGEIVEDVQTYPNSAYTHMRLDSEQFSSIPQRSFRIRGIKVRIPGAGASNSGTPTVVTNQTQATALGLGTVSSFGFIHYPSGYIFNGTMQAATWCSCPSMVLLDLLTTERYGFGTHITDNDIDLFSFVAASRYANELVSDGQGGTEARFSCNVNIQSAQEAFNLIQDLASVMRCMPIWTSGSVTISQDRPTDSSYLFSLSNITSDGFNYSGSSLKQRHTVVNVSYFNMDTRQIDYEVVEDIVAQSKLGVVIKDVKAFATTSRGQAQRLGKAILFSEQNESEVVNFTTSMDAGAIVRPGAVITINDPVRGGERRSGRIAAATTTQITLDSSENLDTFTGNNKKISVIMPNGTVETKLITGISGLVVTLASALSSTPNTNSIWLLESDSFVGQTFRVISVEEKDEINYEISALSYVAGKYDNIEQGITLPTINISVLNELKDPPTNVQASERMIVRNNRAMTKIILSWVAVKGVSQYEVQFRFAGGNWTSQKVFRSDFEIVDNEVGLYEFKVFSYNAAQYLSSTSSNLSFNAQGKTAPPADVQNLTLEPINDSLVRLRWDKSVDLDVIHFGSVYIRHSNLTDGTGTFQNAVDLVTALSGNTTEAVVPSLEGEYILKFQDDGGRFSVGETSVVMDLPNLIDTQVILEDREDLDTPPFNGATTNTIFNVTTSALQLSNPTVNATGEYEFSNVLDLGGVFSLNLQRVIRSIGFNIGDNIETLIPNGSFWDDYATDGNFDGAAANNTNTQIQVATSQSSSGTFGSFNTFANGVFKGQRFKFKLLLETTNTAQNMNVQQAGFNAEFQSRTEQSYKTGSGTSIAPQQSGTSSKNIVFGSPFFVGTSSLGGLNAYLPSVGVTIQNAESGDFFNITNLTGSGFTISVKNGSSFVDRSFTFQAVGYGKGV
tara:strand:+ start:2618 stop:6025 length:3408 start_codon:yes stop_codon:yes gene_type:complete